MMKLIDGLPADVLGIEAAGKVTHSDYRDVLIPRGALIGYDLEEDRRRHTVTESGVVIVTPDDEPLIGPISDDALRFEAAADRRGSAEMPRSRGGSSAPTRRVGAA